MNKTFKFSLVLIVVCTMQACRTPPIIHPNPIPASASATTEVSLSLLNRRSIATAEESALMPATVDEVAYIASPNGRLYSILKNNSTAWSIKIDEDITAGVGANYQTVAVATKDGVLHVFNAADGKALWQQSIASEVLGPPAVTDSRVIVRTADGLIIGFDERTGNRVWLLARPIGALSVRSHHKMLVLNGLVVAGGAQGLLFAFTPANGRVIWERNITRASGVSEVERLIDIVSTPVAEPDIYNPNRTRICATSFNGKTACVRAQDGQLLWQANISSSSGLAMSSDRLWVVARDDVVYALSLFDGRIVWQNKLLKGRALGTPVLTDKGLMIVDGLGYLLLLNPDNGDFILAAATPGAIANVKVVDSNPRYLSVAPIRWQDSYLVQSRQGTLTTWQ